MNEAIVIEAVDPQGEVAMALLRLAALDARALYPELFSADAPMPTNPPAQEGSAYVAALVDGAPAGCGALRRIDATAAEVRRMYVLQSHRGRGVARAILSHLERTAAALGYRVLRLETGYRQQPAMRLYEAYGFRRIAAFGPYTNDPTSVCFEKEVADAGQR